MKSRISTSGVRLALVFGLVALANGCDKSDQIRSDLEADRAAWSRQIATLQSRTSDLEARYRALPPAPKSGEGVRKAEAQRRRGLASIIGAKQTLSDIQSHIAASAREVEEEIGKGTDEGQEALNGLAGRVNEFVRQQEQALAVSEEAITQMGKDVGP